MMKCVKGLSMDDTNVKILSNKKVNPQKLKLARQIIEQMQQELAIHITKGAGPFMAAVYD